MLNIQLLCIGKLKESYWREACASMQKGFPLFAVFPLSSCQKAAFQRRPPLRRSQQPFKPKGKKF